MTIDTLLKKIKIYNPDADFELIKKAYDFAKKAHQGQKRESGEDYIEHPLQVAYYLADMKLSANTIAAGLLHDVVEDTEITNKDIQKEFGKEIAFLVEGISKLGKIKYHGVQRHVENLRKIFLAMARDIRVVLIKFCDQLHNLETLSYLPPEKQKRIAMETLEIYAPLCYRLGMGGLKGRLEDVAFPYVYPKEYQKLLDEVKEQYKEREKYLKKVNSVVEKKLKKSGVMVIDIHSRSKRYYSLYKKLQRYDNDLNKIYDLVALRIIVKDIKDCYRALGIIHKFWKPLPGRIKDYIAMPKLNTYRSLHTTVFCLGGKIIELQIRTPKMHKEAEFGIAAHWYYSEQKGIASRIKKLIAKAPEKKLQWVTQLQEWQKEAKDLSPDEYLKSLKIDFFKNRIFVFTPRGDVIDLPDGATPVDFAYAVHTEVGNKCAGAKINDKMASLSQLLKNEDVVEIVIDKKRSPSQDWLKFVKTNMARSRIKNWLKRKSQPSRLIKGKQILNQAIQDIKVEEKKVIKSLKISLKPKKKAKVFIAGKTGYLINLAKCCDPKPGDKIQAYITKDQGASVHKIDCKNLKQAQKKWPQKIIDASWKKKDFKEKANKSVSVFLKRKDGKALLTRRSPTQSSPGVYQPSTNGKLKKGEDWLPALQRELGEELGEKLAKILKFSDFKLIHEELYIYKNISILGRNYLGLITDKQVKLINLAKEFDKIYFVGKKDIDKIKTIKQIKKSGFNPDKEIIMFADQLKALKKIF